MTRRMMSFKPLTVVFFATVCRRREIRKEERKGEARWYAPQCENTTVSDLCVNLSGTVKNFIMQCT